MAGIMILPSNSGPATKWVNSQPEVTHMTKSASTTKKPRKQHTPELPRRPARK
ncbi:hypothetical protein GPD45_002871 [Salmonella enterica]|nr:hypothetical protein [Salmonella enterica]